MEVILLSIGVGETVTGILHACGGDPLLGNSSANYVLVFSTYVEVILIATLNWRRCAGILHVCGGDPIPPRSRLK